jgi:uncharacterized membrane protein YhhN
MLIQYLTLVCSASLLVVLVFLTRLKGRFHKRIFTGMVFALAGLIPAALEDPGSYTFYSISAFLLTCIFYSRAFYLDFLSAPELDKKGARIAILLTALFSISCYFYFRPHLGVLKLPALVVTLVMSIMVMMSAFRNQRVNPSSFYLILFATITFLISGILTAYDHFIQHFTNAGLLIAITYLIANSLLTAGTVKRKLLHLV